MLDANLLSAIGSCGQVLAGVAGVVTSVLIYRSQHRREQKVLIVPLWEHMSKICNIDPKNPCEPDVISAVNTMELIALCCEGGMVDEKVIKRTFREGYIETCDQIKGISNLKSRGISGEDLLKENKALFRFYVKLQEEENVRDKLN